MYDLIHTYFNVIDYLLWFLYLLALNKPVIFIYSLCKSHTETRISNKKVGYRHTIVLILYDDV